MNRDSKHVKQQAARRRERIFTLLGAAVLLATFLVHEVLREKSKDLSDTVERAEDRATLRGEIATLRALAGSTLTLLRTVQQPHLSQLDRASVGIDFQDTREHEQRLGLQIADLSMLIDSLTDKAKYVTRLQQLQDQMGKADKLLDQSATILNMMQPKDSANFRQYDAISNEEWGIIRSVEKDLSAVSVKVLEDAKETASVSNRRYNTYTEWSYGLYAVGFLLNLAGQLIGVKNFSGE